MKLTIYSFKTLDDYKLLRENFDCLGVDIMYDSVNKLVRHTADALRVFALLTSSCKNVVVLCNNGDVVGNMLAWCDDYKWEAEVVYCSEGRIDTAPMVDAILTNWTFGWYLTE